MKGVLSVRMIGTANIAKHMRGEGFGIEFEVLHKRLGKIGELQVARRFKTGEQQKRYGRYVRRYVRAYGYFPNFEKVPERVWR